MAVDGDLDLAVEHCTQLYSNFIKNVNTLKMKGYFLSMDLKFDEEKQENIIKKWYLYSNDGVLIKKWVPKNN